MQNARGAGSHVVLGVGGGSAPSSKAPQLRCASSWSQVHSVRSPCISITMLQVLAQARLLPARPAARRSAGTGRFRGRRAVITAVAEKDTGVGEPKRGPSLPSSCFPGCRALRKPSLRPAAPTFAVQADLRWALVSPPPVPPAESPTALRLAPCVFKYHLLQRRMLAWCACCGPWTAVFCVAHPVVQPATWMRAA